LRHSSICRALLAGVPTSVVARLHDTSSRIIEAHYGAFIADFADGIARKGLLGVEPPEPVTPVTLITNVVPLTRAG
jgi:hypothetical protein